MVIVILSHRDNELDRSVWFPVELSLEICTFGAPLFLPWNHLDLRRKEICLFGAFIFLAREHATRKNLRENHAGARVC